MKGQDRVARWHRPLAVLSGIGFALSAIVNAGLRLRWFTFADSTFMPLFFGVFVVWFPTVIAMQRLQGQFGFWGGFKVWGIIGKGAPVWMGVVAVGSFLYAMVNFFSVMPQGSTDVSYGDATFAVAGSGHTMAFYAIAAWINWAAYQRRVQGKDWVCENGHPVGPTDKFCRECGARARNPVEPG